MVATPRMTPPPPPLPNPLDLLHTHEQSYSVDPGDSGRTGCPGWVAAFGVTDRLGLARSGLVCSGPGLAMAWPEPAAAWLGAVY